MKDANVFIADPGNTRAILAVSALARAMKEENKVAIVRCVWRHGQGNVIVGVLTPNVSDKDNIVGFTTHIYWVLLNLLIFSIFAPHSFDGFCSILILHVIAWQPDSFNFNVLPFVEDVREFQFPSFNNFPASWQPNEQQQEAADDLVKLLDLAPSGKEEALQPEFTPNPVLQVLHSCNFTICIIIV